MQRDEVLKEFKETFGVELPADVATIVAVLVDEARQQALEEAARWLEPLITATVDDIDRDERIYSQGVRDSIDKIRTLAKGGNDA